MKGGQLKNLIHWMTLSILSKPFSQSDLQEYLKTAKFYRQTKVFKRA